MRSARILSIDIFRGLTIFTMVFVNELAGVSNIPDWMKHVPPDADAMTFVDVVFPAFLFIVGMSIPFAYEARIRKGQRTSVIWTHIITRTVGLWLLGVFMVNSEEMNGEASLIPRRLWDSLLYISAILIWNQYPRDNRPWFYNGLKILGLIVLLILAALYRKGDPPDLRGMTISWWGILGLIGWAYLLSMIIYQLFKDNLFALAGSTALFVIMVVGLKSNNMELPAFLSWLDSGTGHLAHATLTLEGILLSVLLLESSPVRSHTARIQWMIGIGVFNLIAAWFFRPLYGISKVYATPSWVLYCVAICCFLYALIYWIVDVKGRRRWADFLKPAGANPLLTYILPGLLYGMIGFSFIPSFLKNGVVGIIYSIVFALLVLAISAFMTRNKIRLRF